MREIILFGAYLTGAALIVTGLALVTIPGALVVAGFAVAGLGYVALS